MGYAKEILSLVADQLVGDDDYFTVKRLGNGFISLGGRFRVKPKKASGGEKVVETQDELPDMSKPKKSVKAKFSECKSKNPMRCRYHGAIYATNAIKAILANHGIAADDVSVKRIDEGTYDFSIKIPEDEAGAVKEDLKKFYENNELEPLSAEYDKNGYYSVMYEAEEELDPDEQAEVETLKVDYDNTKKSVEELSTLGMSLSPEDAQFLNDELAEQNKTAEEMAETISMLGVDNTDDGWDDGWENDGKVVPKPEEGLPSLPELPENLDELTRVDAKLGGSTGPTLWQDKNGNKFIVKTGGMAGGDPEGHVTNEYYGLKAYRAMGVFCPDAKLLKDKNGNTVMIENFIEGKPLGDYLDTCDAAEFQAMKEQIKDTTFADVLLGNWDAAGTPDITAGDYPNMLVVDGKICRIDPGGWGKYRAQGALKNKEDWADGYPNEVFSMKEFGTTRDFIKDMSTYDLVNQIAGKDLTGLIAALPEEDRKVMQKRIHECRELAETGRNYVEDGGYTKETADTVLWYSLQLAKGGGREALNYGEISFDTIDDDTMKYAAGEDGVGGGNSEETVLSKKIESFENEIEHLSEGQPVPFVEIRDKILDALKSINYHAEKGGAYNSKKIDDALATIETLERVKKQIDEDGDGFLTMHHSMIADSYLEQLNKIKKVKESGKLKKLPKWDVSDEGYIPPYNLQPTAEELDKAANLRKQVVALKEQLAKIGEGKSLFTGMSPSAIVETLCMKDNDRTGLKAKWQDVKDSIASQGSDTWASSSEYAGAHFIKLAECAAMGYDPTTMPMSQAESSSSELSVNYATLRNGENVFCGLYRKGTNISTANCYEETVKYIKEHPQKFESFKRAYLAMKAVQSAIFANTKFKDCDRNNVMVKRQLKKFIANTYELKEDQFNIFPCGFSESTSYGDSNYDEGERDEVVCLAKMPVSRLTGMFCWGGLYQHPGEREFGANLIGLPLYVLRGEKMNYDDNRYKPYFDFAKNNPTMTQQNTHVVKPKIDA